MRLLKLSGRALMLLVAVLGLSTASRNVAWAQNENETVGFRPGHTFESGTFGEALDTLNGGLNLSVPVGQQFVITPRLQYGLKLAYNSKVWDTSDYHNSLVDTFDQVVPTQRSPFGLGFTMNLGRLFKDPSYVSGLAQGTSQNPQHTESWVWVSPDGAQHQFFDGNHYTDLNIPEGVVLPADDSGAWFSGVMTNDNSYYRIAGLGVLTHCPAGLGLLPAEKCIAVQAPEGIVYTLVKQVECTNPPAPPSALYGKGRAENQSFCGWYTALIEDRTVGSPDTSTGLYPHYVKVTYDRRTNFTHAISRIEDSVGRVITFHNCEWTAGSNPAGAEDKCIAGSRDNDTHGADYEASNRNAVATFMVEVPSFGNDATVLKPNSIGVYKFWYEYVPLNRGNIDNQSLLTDPSLKLVRMDYSGYTQPGEGLPDAYSTYFGYAATADGFCGEATSGDDFGELTCRTLPLRRNAAGVSQIVGNPCISGGSYALITYHYNVYRYFAAYLSGGNGGNKQCSPPSGTCAISGPTFVPTGMARQVVQKTVSVPDGVGTSSGTWTYCRNGVVGQTNPTKVTVKDPFNNETVYRYYDTMLVVGHPHSQRIFH